MPREKELFRDNLELLLQAYPTQKVLSLKDVMDYTGRGYRYCKKHYNITGRDGISITKLASLLS